MKKPFEEFIKPGAQVRVVLAAQREVRHIRAIVDDHVVYKVWRKYKGYWSHRIEPIFAFKLWYDAGWIELKKRGEDEHKQDT